MKWRFVLFGLLFFCQLHSQTILILGSAQDAGYPHIGCKKECCKQAWKNQTHENVVSFALVDTIGKKWWMFEATPNITEQLNLFKELTDSVYPYLPAGIFITHAHIGHYTGLMYLGKEALNAKKVPIYCLPKMASFLKKNGPWSQLVKLENIAITILKENDTFRLNERISVLPFRVPHRDEYSETAGFNIKVASKRILFIPDIDKWYKWNKNIVDEVENSDLALLDATFFSDGELSGRNMKEIPHPFVNETFALFDTVNSDVRNRIYFIHFNHTNPLLWDDKLKMYVLEKGYRIAYTKLKIYL